MSSEGRGFLAKQEDRLPGGLSQRLLYVAYDKCWYKTLAFFASDLPGSFVVPFCPHPLPKVRRQGVEIQAHPITGELLARTVAGHRDAGADYHTA
jgi:hypothetical protein